MITLFIVTVPSPRARGEMGVRADTYLRAGGWRGLETAEDHDLWKRLMGTACRQRSTARFM